MLRRLAFVQVLALTVVACGNAQVKHPQLDAKSAQPLVVTSKTFAPNGWIPSRNSAYGANVSPDLTWSTAPADTKSFAVVVFDQDAKPNGFYHWGVFNISPETNQLPAGLAGTSRVSGTDSMQVKNGTGKVGYYGPHPPAGSAHHYHFTVYALDQVVSLQPGTAIDHLLTRMAGHVLAKGELVGLYRKR